MGGGRSPRRRGKSSSEERAPAASGGVGPPKAVRVREGEWRNYETTRKREVQCSLSGGSPESMGAAANDGAVALEAEGLEDEDGESESAVRMVTNRRPLCTRRLMGQKSLGPCLFS
jgi:hypothetical protein